MRSYQPTVKPGLVDPELSCPECGLGQVEYISGGSWRLVNIPQPHYLCYNCLNLFHIPLPRKPSLNLLWKSA